MLIAALGSSFAAGPTLEPVADRAAMRSALNYPHRLAAALGAELVDLTVSGATCGTILEHPQVIAPGVRFAPQIDGLPAGADLVTVTAGGNDLRFIGSMMTAAWLRHDPRSPMAALLAGQPQPVPEVGTAGFADAVGGVAADLARIVARVRARAPRARVVLVDYLTVLDPASRSAVVEFTDAELAGFRARQDGLEEAFRIAADRSGAPLVAASAHSRGHGLGAPEPWVADFVPDARRTAGSFHPTAGGMAAVAGLLVEALR
ncbi:GDSL-type esterase/lipase family protein [Nakamurella sp.]|uniref:GDSL-type esterase/lipase family protein n=1 Tax=Nakamurella sp. TaxID=1869182 RepID=UPI003B3AED45